MDDEEVDRNYAASLQRHETIYQEKANNSRWAELWIHSCVVELTDEQAFRAATRDISFLSQIGVTFDFSSTNNLDEDLLGTKKRGPIQFLTEPLSGW